MKRAVLLPCLMLLLACGRSSPAQQESKPKPFQAPASQAPLAPQEQQPLPPRKEPRNFVGKMQRVGAGDLLVQLLAVPEVSLDTVPGASKELVALSKALTAQRVAYPGPLALAGRPDLAGLPFRMGDDCKLDKATAETLQRLSVNLRSFTTSKGREDDPEGAGALLTRLKDLRPEWRTGAAVPTLTQMLQAEVVPIRKALVAQLASIDHDKAGEALALRACVDPDPAIRAAAVQALKARPSSQYAHVLVSSLTYPWPPVAWHAAEAIATLDIPHVVPEVIQLLETPDPLMPTPAGHTTVVRELVKVNHLSNCVLCHAPSEDRKDLVRGAVPVPGKKLPPPQAYYDRGSSFVRADITYLRQDFSMVLPVLGSDPWPLQQRFDFLVRQRPLSPDMADLLTRKAKERKTTEQKEAMLFVLRELTGKDLGTTAREWSAVLPLESRPRPTVGANPGSEGRGNGKP